VSSAKLFGSIAAHQSSPLPARITTWFSESAPMSAKQYAASSCDVPLQTRLSPPVWNVTSRTPSRRSSRMFSYAVA